MIQGWVVPLWSNIHSGPRYCRSAHWVTEHPGPAWQVRWVALQSTRGMTVKGTAGLLASSSKAVRKHSVAAASLP